MKKLFLFIFIIITGCQNNIQETKNNIIPIRNTEPTDKLKLIEPRLLRLESNPFAQISGIDKIIFFANRIIVLDKLIGNSVFIYDSAGNFINHIYRVGEGPGEYRNVENVYWNSFTKELVLIPMDFKKKVFFDQSGVFLREEFFDEQIVYADLVFLEDGEIIINNSLINGGPNVVIYQDGIKKMSGFPFDPLMDNSPMDKRNILSKMDEDTYLISLGLRDTLYSINVEDYLIKSKYILDFGNEVSFESINDQQDPVQYFMENDIYVGAIDLFQNQRFLSFSTLHSTGLKGRIYSKKTGVSYSTNKLIEQKVGKLGFEGVLSITPKNEFVAILSSGESGKWDFSFNPSLEKQFADFGHVDKEELILMLFDLEEDN